MQKNTNSRMENLIIGMLSRENFNVFTASSNDQGSSVIVRNILNDQMPQYIEICFLSRTVEYEIEICTPIQKSENVFYYYVLYSPGMNKIWLLRDDELESLRNDGLDDRDSSPYLVNNFNRLKTPQLSLEEYKNL